MCVDHRVTCSCGRNTASFNFRDEVMPVEVIERLYCPECSRGVSHSDETMLMDNNWIIEYDMDIANFASGKLPGAAITPEFIFDQGYCTWRGIYPGDHVDSAREREELLTLAKINAKKYFEEFRRWGVERMERLSREGWRKANVAP